MQKVLIVTSVASMIQQFCMPDIRLLQEMGCEVHVACNFIEGSTCPPEKVAALQEELAARHIPYFQIDFSRSLQLWGRHCTAYRQLHRLMQEQHYTFLHCHSPIGGALARLAAHRVGLPAIYTAHGFHFYRGAPGKNWLLLYPVEKRCSRMTDVLITINQEDYARATRKFRAHRTVYVPGVGIDTARFAPTGDREERRAVRQSLGVPEDACLMVSVGELNANKNHATILRAMAAASCRTVHYAIAGQGAKRASLLALAEKLGVSDRFHLIGFCDAVSALYRAADICAFPSVREGLGLAALEGMAAGLPLLAADNRGTRDLCRAGENAILCASRDVAAFAAGIDALSTDPALRAAMGQCGQERARAFDRAAVAPQMRTIYQACLEKAGQAPTT